MSATITSRIDRVRSSLDLSERVAVVTGGAGLLGVRHAEAIAEMGGVPILVDIHGERLQEQIAGITSRYQVEAVGIEADVTQPDAVSDVLDQILSRFRRVDILINNAAVDPKVGGVRSGGPNWSRLENLPLEIWNQDLSVGLTGAFLCSRIIGGEMARRGRGVILNIASDLGVIAPDQRIYRQADLADELQPVKPITYSVVKHGLIGLTKYLATYWAKNGVRVNALSPGGVYQDQDPAFVERLSNLIPMGRMARLDEYMGAVVFLVSDASSYMTGANLVIDGGRTVW
jgi:NAD(P)-dependent dehydrogenase (short-subunit alcohol dehydrogenase family)